MQTIRTIEKRERFLEALKLGKGNVSKALEAAAMSRTAAYDWRNEDEDFRNAWDEVVEASTDDYEDEAWRRAFDGVEEPVFYQGKNVGTINRKSDTLLMFMLKSRRPEKFRDNSKVELGGVGGGPLTIEVEYVQEKQTEGDA